VAALPYSLRGVWQICQSLRTGHSALGTTLITRSRRIFVCALGAVLNWDLLWLPPHVRPDKRSAGFGWRVMYALRNQDDSMNGLGMHGRLICEWAVRTIFYGYAP
jgi:hypothetical protein